MEEDNRNFYVYIFKWLILSKEIVILATNVRCNPVLPNRITAEPIIGTGRGLLKWSLPKVDLSKTDKVFVLKHTFLTEIDLYKADTCLRWTKILVPWVSAFDRFRCSWKVRIMGVLKKRNLLRSWLSRYTMYSIPFLKTWLYRLPLFSNHFIFSESVCCNNFEFFAFGGLLSTILTYNYSFLGVVILNLHAQHQ